MSDVGVTTGGQTRGDRVREASKERRSLQKQPAELGTLVARALSVDYPGQSNGQVRDVPDRRTIRYYTTLGLLDRPAEMRGRTALYGQRHLLQLVAVEPRAVSLADINDDA